MVRRCWVNFQCRGVPLIWIIVGQGPTALAVGAGGGCLDIFTLIYPFSPLSPSLWETARYRLKYCLKGPLNPKQPTNQPTTATIAIALNGRGTEGREEEGKLEQVGDKRTGHWIHRQFFYPRRKIFSQKYTCIQKYDVGNNYTKVLYHHSSFRVFNVISSVSS